MNFKKQYLTPTYLCIIDIGSYKIRVSACQFLNKQATLLGYLEKRQDTNNFINQECRDIVELSENINEAITRLEKQCKITLDQVVVNFPFGELFVATKTMNYKRSLPHAPIKDEELETIIERAENLSLKKLCEEIREKTSLWKDEIELVLSRIHQMKIDGVAHDKLLGEDGENVRVSLLNIFVPLSKYNLINHLGNIIEKKISKIIPTEYCMSKVFSDENIVILNIGATQTSITIKKENEVLWVSKIGIGINDLLSKIAESHKETKIDILSKLDTLNLYQEEKDFFLDIWSSGILVGIKDIIGDSICPKEFLILWGGGNNSFIQEALQELDFQAASIKIVTPLQFKDVVISDYLQSIHGITPDIEEKINLDTIALILETNNLISHEKDAVTESLKKVVRSLWYNLA